MIDRSSAAPGEGGDVGRAFVLPGKNPTLVPTPSLSADEFEDFTERLLSAHRFCVPQLRKVVRVERWGRRGDKQDGIDFVGTFSDGATAAWQCKRHDELTVAKVRAAVAACTFAADEYYLVFSGEASSGVRAEIVKHPRWQLVDQRGLGRLLDDLPLHKRREVLDATWGKQQRKLLLRMPGEDAFVSLEAFATDRKNPDTLLNDLVPRVGRDAELERLAVALDRSVDRPVVVLVSGPGGRGKSRLLVEALTPSQQDNPDIPVLLLSQGAVLDDTTLEELPYSPAVIVVDDAHQHREGIARLLTYARHVAGIQLILASRPSGIPDIRSRITASRISSAQVAHVEVGELTKAAARSLVESLTEGLGLPWGLREHLAAQAVDSPYVAVVAANLIRRGELTAPLAVDAELRQQVLSRYQELALDGIDDNPARRLLAVYAALGSVDDNDADLRAQIAAFCGLGVVALLRLVEQLRDRGVLVDRHGGTRVTPDVLADEILEREAAVGRHDTGFVRELWQVFGPRSGGRLVTELAELDWRLTRQDGPAVFVTVWEAVLAELHETDFHGLYEAVNRFGGLAVTQPRLLIGALESVRARLDATENDQLDRRSVERVLHLLAERYGRCAANAPELLETALDALWELRRSDRRPAHRHPEHPERVIAEQLVNLGRLPDGSFPTRILDRVETWLAAPARPQDTAIPLSVLKPMLAKDGHHTVQDNRNTLRFDPFLVSPNWARPIRDRIRAILRHQASGDDLRCAGAAVNLLEQALRAPQGDFGYSPTDEEVLAWEDDDLATVATLAGAARATGSPVIRRLIRRAVTWPAGRALSLPLRHAALVLATELDEQDDDLAELALGRGYSAVLSRRGVPVPTLDELQAERAAEDAGEDGLPEEQRQARSQQRIQERIALKSAERQALADRVIGRLVTSGDPAWIVATLDEALRQARAVEDRHATAPFLLREIARARPGLAADLTQAVVDHTSGPLDEQLRWLLIEWVEADQDAAVTWLDGLTNLRVEVRLAVADAFVGASWVGRGEPFAHIHSRGLADPDPAVRDRFLLATHPLLKANPVETTEFLLASDVSSDTATGVLEHACGYDGATWGSGFDEPAAAAVLQLISRTDWSDYTVQQIATAIARAHPVLVLRHLSLLHDEGRRLPTEIDEMADAFDQAAADLVRWLVDTMVHSPDKAVAVTRLAMSGGVTARQAEHLQSAVDTLDGEELLAMATALRTHATWPLNCPELARRMTHRARTTGHGLVAAVREQIAAAMRPSHWSYSNGRSSELGRATTNAAEALASEEDDELREDFQRALDWLEEETVRLMHRHEEWMNG
ncbi:ATP-binding protein [Actinosynnema sp. NPDC023658]|uniref:ATP-binding protein n=1 Tax=Actinosynnema sp. NPDC023658 TaxID=3155465 RepID=UPI0033CEAD73